MKKEMEKNYNKNYEGVIYKATNTINGKSYIGATCHSIRQRQLDHIERALRNESGKFQEAISTYGEEAFEWTMIDTAQTINELAEKEKKYILNYSSKEDGYNTDSGGGFKKDVYQYDIYEGKLLNTYSSLSDAAKNVEVTKQDISRACLSINKRCNGYYWSYNYKEPFKPDKDTRKKKVLQFTLDGDFIAEYSSVSEASRQTGISKTCISRVCREERKKTRNFIFRYK